MTTVKVERDGDFVTGLTVTGHAGFSDAGDDVVCAAVSAITQTAILGLKAFEIGMDFKRREGMLKIKLHAPLEGEARVIAKAILDTAVFGLKDIHKGYPAFVRVEE